MKINKEHFGQKLRRPDWTDGSYFIPLGEKRDGYLVGEVEDGETETHPNYDDWEFYAEHKTKPSGLITKQKEDHFSNYEKFNEGVLRARSAGLEVEFIEFFIRALLSGNSTDDAVYHSLSEWDL